MSFYFVLMPRDYLCGLAKIRKFGQQLRGDFVQVLVGREVLELGVVSIGHDPNVWKTLREEVSKPHNLGLLVSPCVKGMAVKAMNRDETGFNVRKNSDMASQDHLLENSVLSRCPITANIWWMQDGNSKRSVFTHCRLSVHRNGGRLYRKKKTISLSPPYLLSQLNLDIQVDISGLLYSGTQSQCHRRK